MDYASVRAALDTAAEQIERAAGAALEYAEQAIDFLENVKEYLPEDEEVEQEPQAPAAGGSNWDKVDAVLTWLNEMQPMEPEVEAQMRADLQDSQKLTQAYFDLLSRTGNPDW